MVLWNNKNYIYIKYDVFHDIIAIVKSTIFKLKIISTNIYFKNYFITSILKVFLTKHIKLLFFNFNFNHSFNQTPIFSNQTQLKTLFIKQFFLNHNHNSYYNTKHTLKAREERQSKISNNHWLRKRTYVCEWKEKGLEKWVQKQREQR